MLAATRRFPYATKDSRLSIVVWCSYFFVNWCVYGFSFSFGIIYTEFLEKFKDSHSKTAWVGSLPTSLMCLCAPVCLIIARKYGEFKVMYAGVVIMVSSLLLSSLATSIDQLIVSFGVLYGIGSCCIASLSLLILPRVFDKKLATAFGLGSCGASLGPLTFTPILSIAFKEYGWRRTFQIFAGAFGIILFISVSSFFLGRRPRQIVDDREEHNRLVVGRIYRAIRNPVVIIFTLAVGIACLEYMISYTHQVQFAIEKGLSREKASMLPTYMALANTGGRIAAGFLIDLKFMDLLYLFQVFILGTGIISFLGSLARTYVHFIIYFVALMFFEGAFAAQHIYVLRRVAGDEIYNEAAGILLFVEGFFIATGPPLLGRIVDDTNDYSSLFYVVGSPLLIGGTMLFFCRCPKTKMDYLVDRKPLFVEQEKPKDSVVVTDNVDVKECLIHKISVL